MPSNGVISKTYKDNCVVRGNSKGHDKVVDDDFGLGVYKYCGHQTARNSALAVRTFSRLGLLQKLILSIIGDTYPFKLSDIQIRIKNRYGVEVSLKRLHDAVARLVKRRILAKTSRGCYQLTVDYDSSVIEVLKEIRKEVRSRVNDEVKENLFSIRPVVEVEVLRGFGCGGSCVEGLVSEPPGLSGGFAIYKVHSPGDFMNFYVNYNIDYYVKDYYRGCLDDWLHYYYYGYSKYAIKKLRRRCKKFALMIVKHGIPVIGCHGVYGHKVGDGYDCRGFRKFDGFMPLKDCDDIHTYEKGINIYVPLELLVEPSS
jgi:hypothetical protein